MNNKDITNIIEFLTPEAKQRFEEGGGGFNIKQS